MNNKNEWKKAGNSGLMTNRTWNPDTEKSLQGILLESREVTKKDNTKSKVYVIKASDGKLVTVWGAAMLDRLMMEPAIGDEVKITFVKKSFNKETGRSLKEFTVDYRSGDGTAVGTTTITEEKTGDKPEGDDIPF